MNTQIALLKELDAFDAKIAALGRHATPAELNARAQITAQLPAAAAMFEESADVDTDYCRWTARRTFVDRSPIFSVESSFRAMINAWHDGDAFGALEIQFTFRIATDYARHTATANFPNATAAIAALRKLKAALGTDIHIISASITAQSKIGASEIINAQRKLDAAFTA